MSEYREFGPSPALHAHVQCFWAVHRQGAGETASHRVLPDGCMDLILDFGALASGEPFAELVGTMTTALVLPSSDSADLLGVRFRPGAAASLFGVKASELTGSSVSLDRLLGPEAGLLKESLLEEESPGPCPRTAGRIKRIESALQGWLGNCGSEAQDPAFTRFLGTLTAEPGPIRTGEVARRSGVGERTLERWFQERVGISPKAFARVMRLRRLIRMRAAFPRRTWSELALEAGYSDQPHMTREFKALAGVSPNRYAGDDPSLSRIFKTPSAGRS